MSIEYLIGILKYRPVSIGANIIIKNATFKFWYNLTLVPSLGFEVTIDKDSLYFGGDSCMNKEILTDMLNKNVIC